MKCPKCNGKILVKDSRQKQGVIKRTRICDNCAKIIYTVEITEDKYYSLLEYMRKSLKG